MFYRTENTIINNLLIYFTSQNEYRSIKAFIQDRLSINEYIVYSLPEGLWVFCTALISRDFYFKVSGRVINCVYFPLVFSIGLEFFQLVRITNGTFDFFDIISATIFWFTAFLFIKSPNDPINIYAEKKVRSLSFLLSYTIVFLSDVWV